MQPNFLASQHDWLIKNVGREIVAAIEAKYIIIFLEYATWSVGIPVMCMTYQCLTDLTKNYKNAIIVHKQNPDGSQQVVDILEGIDYQICARNRKYDDVIRVVGVETDICVTKTVNSLTEKMPDTKIVIVGDACAVNSACPQLWPDNQGQEDIKRGKNVEILKVKRYERKSRS